MIRFKRIIILVLGLGLIGACADSALDSKLDSEQIVNADTDLFGLVYHFEDEFNEAEQVKLTNWIDQIYTATQKTLGVYPFDVHIHFYASTGSASPVSFGFARRNAGTSAVTFYVNPSASSDDLLGDWVAPHELSHLSIPFFGKSCKWFTEGYATFFSRQIMMDMGYYSQASFDSTYLSGIQIAAKVYDSDERTFIERSNELLDNHHYSSMYWGSASFLFTIDKKLRANQNRRFVDIIKEYQVCCRLSDITLRDVIQSFDELIGEPWCSELMVVYRNKSANDALSEYR